MGAVWLLASFCLQAAVLAGGSDSSLEVRLQDLHAIGGDSSRPAEQLLGFPEFAAVDGEFNVYIADRAVMGVKVFDGQGRFLNLIGSRGREPGRLREISALLVDRDGTLLIADNFNSRILRMKPDGQRLSSYPINEFELTFVGGLASLGDGGYLVPFYRGAGDLKGLREFGGEDLLHRFDQRFEKSLAHFAGYRQTGLPDEAVGRVYTRAHPGRLWMEGESSLLFAPSLYRGRIYRFAEEDGEWALKDTIRGYTAQEEPYSVLRGESELEDAGFITTASGERLGARLHNLSKGVFRLEDGRIAHFSIGRDGEKRWFGLELFAADNSLLGYAALEEVDASGKAVPLSVECKDGQDRFYLLDRRGLPQVRVVKLQE